LEGREIPSSFACPGGSLSVRQSFAEALWPGVPEPPPFSAALVPAAGDAEAERVLRAHQQAGPCRVGRTRGGSQLRLLAGNSNPLAAAADAARGAGLRLAEAVWREGPPGRKVEGGLLQLVLRSGPGGGGKGSAGGGGGGASVSGGGRGARPSAAGAVAGSLPTTGPCRTAPLHNRGIPSSFSCPKGALSVPTEFVEALWPGALSPLTLSAPATPAPGGAEAERSLSFSAALVPAAGDAEAERVLQGHQQVGPCKVGYTTGYRLRLPLGKDNPLVTAAVFARGAGLRLAEAVWRDGPPGREVEGGLLQLVLRSGPRDAAGSAGARGSAGSGGGGGSRRASSGSRRARQQQ
jgi:hypothetical protein